MRSLITILLAVPTLSLAQPCAVGVDATLGHHEGTLVSFMTVNVSGPPARRYIGIVADPATPDSPVVVTRETLIEGGLLTGFRLPLTTTARTIPVTVYAHYGSGAEETICRVEKTVHVPAYDPLARVAGRLFVPVAGSTSGAFGGKFKTSLRLSGFGTGRIYFRRQGQFSGDERDPFIPYNLGPRRIDVENTIYWDDVFEAFGLSGIGALDVVPDFYPGPGARGRFVASLEARVYNEASVGRFGDLIPILEATDLFREAMSVPLHRDVLATSRINVGVRTFDEPVQVRVSVVNDGALIRLREIELPAHTFRHYALRELMGRDVEPEDSALFLFWHAKPVAAYYTITENTTNDATVLSPRETAPADLSEPVLVLPR